MGLTCIDAYGLERACRSPIPGWGGVSSFKIGVDKHYKTGICIVFKPPVYGYTAAKQNILAVPGCPAMWPNGWKKIIS